MNNQDLKVLEDKVKMDNITINITGSTWGSRWEMPISVFELLVGEEHKLSRVKKVLEYIARSNEPDEKYKISEFASGMLNSGVKLSGRDRKYLNRVLELVEVIK